MSRCAICDCSQSADSLYHNSLAGSSLHNNDVRYSKKLDEFVCLDCRQSLLDQKNYWRTVDGDEQDFNNFEPDYLDTGFDFQAG